MTLDTEVSLETELLAKELSLFEAASEVDAVNLARLLHPDVQEFRPTGVLHGDQVSLNRMLDERDVASVDISEFSVARLSQGAALVQYRTARRKHGRLQEFCLRASVWVSTEQGWKLFFHQQTPSSSPHN